ncbi:MAG: hypothetical protein M1308_23245 [Actinobacteria bacterium]|nr:hypothetical protein [Actinomycetota bacterium]
MKSGLIIPGRINKQQTESIIARTEKAIKMCRSGVAGNGEYGQLFESVAKAQDLSHEELQERISENYIISLALANEPDVNVIGGTETALAFAAQVAMEDGIRRIIKVDAEGGFHTQLMSPAACKFGKKFWQIRLPEVARFPVVLDNGVETTNPQIMRGMHIKIMTNPVNWVCAISKFSNIETVVRIGPGGQVPGITEANGIPKERQIDIVSFLKN